MTGIQYIIDDKGNRTAVVIDLKKHADLWFKIQNTLKAEQQHKKYPLHGVTIQYDNPTEPVADSDWEALS